MPDGLLSLTTSSLQVGVMFRDYLLAYCFFIGKNMLEQSTVMFLSTQFGKWVQRLLA